MTTRMAAMGALLLGTTTLMTPALAQVPASTPPMTPGVRLTAPTTPTPAFAVSANPATMAPDPTPPAALPPVYGANLFEPGRMAASAAIPSTESIVMPGDRISIRVWGATRSDDLAQVDPEGNVFIPEVGPIKVGGLAASAIQGVIGNRVRDVFPRNVDVYASLLTRQPMGVFVTGEVRSPGRHLGATNDSILDWLLRAGGVDAERGSFRRVRVQRGGGQIAQVDLYDFLSNGRMPRVAFQEGDTILVDRVGSQVAVTGEARHPHRFELIGNQGRGDEIIRRARPAPGVTHALIRGTREGAPISTYLDLATFAQTPLHDNDQIEFRTDMIGASMAVNINGRTRGPTTFTVRTDTMLSELLDHIPVNLSEVDIGSVHIRRASVARRQRESLDQALARLEQTVLTARSQTVDEATIRLREAELVASFVQRARSVTPIGRLVVSDGGRFTDTRLEAGDVIVLPPRTDVVTISGEVLVPQAVLHRQGMTIADLQDQAGGPTDRANRSRFLLMRPNGAVITASSGTTIAPGDEVVVLPQVDLKVVQMGRDILSIIYQVAVSSAVLLRL